MTQKKQKRTNTETIKTIDDSAKDVYKKILKKKSPEMNFPIRALSNVKYDPKRGFFELLGRVKTRALNVTTIKAFAQTLKMMGLSKNLLKTNDIATKREAYYVSKNWGDARFNEQTESDSTMDDIEAMFMVN